LIAFLRGEPIANAVAALLREGACVTLLQLAEVHDVMQRRFGASRADVEETLSLLPLEVRPVSPSLAVRAGELRALYYRARTSELSLADCLLIASAEADTRPVATSDRALAKACDLIGLPVVQLAGE
jgi:predicted nucleic acid-binding protein